ncbi:hypothetical protein [Streptomyces sp. SID8499]|uniref:hypothetical protein n=1 Tax=Streptomyces sp. SID8499 TaxID=2706106 RepID=UPI0013C8398A|nr:hypothetical protein [Streptomyces sp. SID8499]NED35568.1 hypothetical protein [Streptomyces sp. SID8499]
MFAQPSPMAPLASLGDAPAVPAALLDADRRSTNPAQTAEAANTFVTVPGAVTVPAPVAQVADLGKQEVDKYHDAIKRGDIQAAASALIAFGVLFEVASAEMGARLDVIEAGLFDALRGDR